MSKGTYFIMVSQREPRRKVAVQVSGTIHDFGDFKIGIRKVRSLFTATELSTGLLVKENARKKDLLEEIEKLRIAITKYVKISAEDGKLIGEAVQSGKLPVVEEGEIF